MKRIACGVLGAVALVASFGAAPAAEWQSYSYTASVLEPAYKGLQRLAADFEKATNGAIKVKTNVGGSLPIKPNNITQAVADGVLPLADDMAFAGNIRVGGLIRLPFLLQTEEDYAKARPIWLKAVEAELDTMGIKLLSEYHYPAQVVFSAQPLTKIEDIKGRKIRVSSNEQGELIKRLGGIPVTLSPPEIASALQSGVISGVLTASAGGGLVWREFFTHNFRLPVNWANSMFVVNKDVWNKLSPADQASLQKAATDAATSIEAELRGNDQVSTDKFRSTGMVVTIPTADEIKIGIDHSREFWDTWAKSKGPAAIAALKEIRTAVGR